MKQQELNDEQSRTHHPKILIIEDEPLIQQIHVMLLKEINRDIDVAKNGKEALEKALETHYDVILMDINTHSIEATKAIRGAGLSKPYIVGLTTHVANNLRKSCIAAGMNILESKPISVERLQEICFRNIT
jgi:CheY-like chemotaxis protein